MRVWITSSISSASALSVSYPLNSVSICCDMRNWGTGCLKDPFTLRDFLFCVVYASRISARFTRSLSFDLFNIERHEQHQLDRFSLHCIFLISSLRHLNIVSLSLSPRRNCSKSQCMRKRVSSLSVETHSPSPQTIISRVYRKIRKWINMKMFHCHKPNFHLHVWCWRRRWLDIVDERETTQNFMEKIWILCSFVSIIFSSKCSSAFKNRVYSIRYEEGRGVHRTEETSDPAVM